MEEVGTSRRLRPIRTVARALLAIAGGISLLLLLAVLYLWVRSYLIAEVIYYKPVDAPEEFASPMPGKPVRWQFQWNLTTCAGKAQAVRRNLGVGEETAAKMMHLRPDDPAALAVLNRRDPLDVDWRLAGVQYFRSDRRYVNTPPVKYWIWGFLIVTVPYWLLAVLTAILPGIGGTQFVRGVRRRRRIARGMCPKCGYDLRGSSGICPECGTKVETTGAALRR